ncbi:hypothetical protein EVAR_33779_1 [Eumeta japonica]|uniref:Uncharacterized protein n=1 Tax=Eumeta variegata TaxID=151549 RepID=A0A4C1VVV0_EUMVA|nr:hypothetical protein EVAR_33779_1 [Eumeta japonica]
MNSRVLTERATSRGSRARQILGRSRRASPESNAGFCACLKAPHRVLTERATSRGSRGKSSVGQDVPRPSQTPVLSMLKAPHRVLTERATSRGSRARQILGRSRRASPESNAGFCPCLKAPHRVLTERAASRGSLGRLPRYACRARRPRSVSFLIRGGLARQIRATVRLSQHRRSV